MGAVLDVAMAQVGSGGSTVTPTLIGRWQTRVFTLATLGVLVTAVFYVLSRFNPLFFFVLGYVLVFGLVWDLIYIMLQKLRWDRDWPAVFQVINGIIEGLFLYLIMSFFGLPGIPRGDVPGWVFLQHYGLVWLISYWWVQGPMRALFPWWRFRGGRIV